MKLLQVFGCLLTGGSLRAKLRALVYDILPPSTAIVNYAIGLKKEKAESQQTVFHWCSNGCKFVTDNSDYIRIFFITDYVAYANTNKTKII